MILLNKEGSEFFEDTRNQALKALKAYPGGLQVGGGTTAENAMQYIEAGASHVIVTSFVFSVITTPLYFSIKGLNCISSV